MDAYLTGTAGKGKTPRGRAGTKPVVGALSVKKEVKEEMKREQQQETTVAPVVLSTHRVRMAQQ